MKYYLNVFKKKSEVPLSVRIFSHTERSHLQQTHKLVGCIIYSRISSLQKYVLTAPIISACGEAPTRNSCVIFMTDHPKQVFKVQTPGEDFVHTEKRAAAAELTCSTVKPWICSPTRYCSALSLAATLFHLHALRPRHLERHKSR